MIRQSQNYFAAAVSAALINAAAITAFVLFTILSSVQGFGLRSVLDAVDSIGSPSQTSVSSDAQGNGSSGALVRDAGSGTARLVPNAGSSAENGTGPADAGDSKRGVGQSGATATGGSPTGPSGGGTSGGGTSGGGTSGSGDSGGPIGGGPTLPSPSTGGPTGSLNIPNTVNDAAGAVTQGLGSATSQTPASGVTNTVTETANGLLGSNPLSGGSGSGSSNSSGNASAPRFGNVNGAVNGATGAVKNAGVTLPGLG